MKRQGIALGNGFRLDSKGKLVRVNGYGLTVSQKIARRKSKKTKVVRRVGE